VKTLGRIWHVLLLVALIAPLIGSSATATAQGFVVETWKSPTYGFTVDYRPDAFWIESEETTNGIDILVLRSEVGWFSVEAMPVTMTPDACVQVMIDEVLQTDGNHEAPVPVEDGTGLIRSTMLAQNGQYTDYTRRIDCITSPDGDYMVRFMHFATTSDHGMWETAARDIRASYRPGIPANNPFPANVTQPDGELEVAVLPLRAIFPAAPSSLGAYAQPVILLTVEFIFTNVSQMDATLETSRIIIAGLGSSVSHIWISGDTLFYDDTLILPPSAVVTGHLTFAIPATTEKVTFCYQHATDNNCTPIGTYDPSADTSGGGPTSRPRINPGR
jgi:hypothetical protein